MCLSCRMCVRSHLLISSDYEGCMALWDVDTGLAAKGCEAHNNSRCASVRVHCAVPAP